MKTVNVLGTWRLLTFIKIAFVFNTTPRVNQTHNMQPLFIHYNQTQTSIPDEYDPIFLIVLWR